MLYVVLETTTGNRAFPTGRYTSAYSDTPSRIGIGTRLSSRISLRSGTSGGGNFGAAVVWAADVGRSGLQTRISRGSRSRAARRHQVMRSAFPYLSIARQPITTRMSLGLGAGVRREVHGLPVWDMSYCVPVSGSYDRHTQPRRHRVSAPGRSCVRVSSKTASDRHRDSLFHRAQTVERRRRSIPRPNWGPPSPNGDDGAPVSSGHVGEPLPVEKPANTRGTARTESALADPEPETHPHISATVVVGRC